MFKVIENNGHTVVDIDMHPYFMSACIMAGFVLTLLWFLFPPHINPLLIFLLGVLIFFLTPCILVTVIGLIGAVLCLFFHEMKNLLGGELLPPKGRRF